MSNLKVGDRVKAYVGTFKLKGNVTQLCADDIVLITTETERHECIVHSRQCRKLKKQTRRSFWVRISPFGIFTYRTLEEARIGTGGFCDEVIEVKETRKKK